MDNLLNSISIIHRQSLVYFDKELKKTDFTAAQFIYILYVHEHPGVSQEDLVSNFMIDKGAVARATKQLVDMGYLTRELSSEDRRQYRIYATKKTEDVYSRIQDVQKKWEGTITSGLTEVETQILNSLLQKIVAAIR